MRVRVGTSGYNYPAWKGRFYPDKLPQKKMLAFYAGVFPTVESNDTFYRLPSAEVLAARAAETPPEFKFACKAWQRVTHQLRLREADEAVVTFCERARSLGDKLGPILFQLPPNLKRDDGRLQALLACLPRDLQVTVEFRHPSWLDDAVYAELERAGVALCVAESDKLSIPFVRTAPFGYLRLRREDYTEADLAAWAARVAAGGFTSDAYVYFKHEDEAKGPAFARAFQERLQAG